MTAAPLTFLSWVRPALETLITGQSSGRATATAQITLTESGPDGTPGSTASQAVSFLIPGPGDVTGLSSAAIVRRYPVDGTLDHESNRCPYVELADPTLPWRYTPAPTPSDASLHPWLVLLVGLEGSELVVDGSTVTIQPAAQQGVQAVGAPGTAYRFAHVQDTGGVRTTRLVSARPLTAGTDYLAVVVPAFDASGAPAWTGAAAVTVALYDAWRFRTAQPAGGFEQLAQLLQPGDAPAQTGEAVLHYPRVTAAAPLSVFGALVGQTSGRTVTEDPLPAAVSSDLAGLRTPARDPQGRPIVGLPAYGDAWSLTAADQSTWGQSLNSDPRHRGVAGLGLGVATGMQEDLIDDAMANLGALREARQAVRQLTLGLAASRSLWQRRMPADPAAKLWLLGPALTRLLTPSGTVAGLATDPSRTIAPGTFSAAARRVLRAGPARTALATAVPTPAGLVISVNRQPPAQPAAIDGVPLTTVSLQSFDTARVAAIRAATIDTSTLLSAASELASASAAGLKSAASSLLAAAQQANSSGQAVAWAPILATLAAGDATVVAQARNPTVAVSLLTHGLTGLSSSLPVLTTTATSATGAAATSTGANAAPAVQRLPEDGGEVAKVPGGGDATSAPGGGGVFTGPGGGGIVAKGPGGGVSTTGPATGAANADLLEMLGDLAPLAADDPTLTAVATDMLAAAVAEAFDPSTTAAPAATRVLSTISGAVDAAQPLAPPELCVGLNRPAWADLAAADPEWLLPGIGQVPENAIVALQSDPIFIDAYLAGLNTQLLTELRFRNIPVATGCTPIRSFWARSDPATGAAAPDIDGIASWAATSPLGDPGHRPTGVTGTELVIAVRGELLERYPTTLVYLQSAVPAGASAADFTVDPAIGGAQVLPTFRGQLAQDVFFFGFTSLDETALSTNWLVLEEAPGGYRFANDVTTAAATGHNWAVATLAQPIRVLIRGDTLIVGGTSG